MERITIVGCGNLGSTLATTIALFHFDFGGVEELTLIDNDILENKNLPFTMMNGKEALKFIGSPKILALEYQVKNIIGDTIKVTSKLGRYPDVGCDGNSFMIDCRDSTNSSSDFNLKLAADGPYGYVSVNPKDNDTSIFTRYVIKRSYYYVSKLAFIFSEFIFNQEFKDMYSEGEYIVNLLTGGEIIKCQ